MPAKNLVMIASFMCSIMQSLHFALLPSGGQAGMTGQVVMLGMSILGYFDSVGHSWATSCYWLLYPAALIAVGAPLLQRRESSHVGQESEQQWQSEDCFWVVSLPLVATLISVRARQLSDMYWLRLLTVFSALPWIPYCVAVRSWSNLFGMCVFLVSSLSAFLQFHGLPFYGRYVSLLVSCGCFRRCIRRRKRPLVDLKDV
eukprot:TRINITY_DN10135_c0_g2_i1.p1 TRINITY_DN10135_c0_g2~~TRINITY_DN10135_c0_g2_i1.p1  ORF type:complete len:226 (-),score=26.03 TRINITY_DN10135_c0_g2_i1:271-873(-)